jgi:hypothetical protein
MDGTSAGNAALQTLRGDLIDIVLGTVFLAFGATACAIAAIRGQGRSHADMVGNFQRNVRPPDSGASVHHSYGSAAVFPVCRSVCENDGQVPASWFLLYEEIVAEKSKKSPGESPKIEGGPEYSGEKHKQLDFSNSGGMLFRFLGGRHAELQQRDRKSVV